LLALNTNKKKYKVFNILNIIIQFIYIVLSESRGTLLACIILLFIGVLYFLNSKEYMKEKINNIVFRLSIYLLIGIAACAILYMANNLTLKIFSNIPKQLTQIDNNNQSTNESSTDVIDMQRKDIIENNDISNLRFSIWSSAFDMFKTSPIFGTSPRNILAYAKDIDPNTFIAMREYTSMHNTYIEILVFTGVLGSSFIFIFFIKTFINMFIYYKNTKFKSDNIFLNYIALIIISILIYSMFEAEIVFADSPSSLIFWIFLSYMISVGALAPLAKGGMSRSDKGDFARPQTKKKICIIDLDLSIKGGSGRVTSILANYLSEKYEVHVISLNLSCGKLAYNFNEKVKTHIIMQEPNYRIRKVLYYSRKTLREIIKTNQIETALLMGAFTSFIGIVNTMFLNIRLVNCDQGSLMGQWNERLTTFIRKLCYIFADKTVVLTKSSLNDYIEKFNVKENKITQIYNPIDEEMIKYAKEYNPDSKKIISVGRFTEEKGFDMAVQAAEELLNFSADWEWHIYGEGVLLEQIKQEIISKNLENHVILKGQRDDIYKLYNDYSILVMPSYREGFSLVLLEGKVNNLPLVSFDINAGPNEIIQNNENGFLIKPYNIQDMAEKINILLNNRELRIEFSNNSSKNINEFNKEVIIEKWSNLIDED